MAHSSQQHSLNPGRRPLRSAGLALGGGLSFLTFLALTTPAYVPAKEADFIPLPQDAVPNTSGKAVIDLTSQDSAASGSTLSPSLPDAFVVRNIGGNVDYDNERRIITYSCGQRPIYLRTAEGQEIFAKSISADLEKKEAYLQGPLVIYQGESLAHAASGTYNWETGRAEVTDIRAKAKGMLVRGTKAEYKKDDKERSFVTVYDAYVSTEDVERPGMWVGTGKMVVYPGDYGEISRLSIAGEENDMPVPILGWVPISHSLNPREGYMPGPGAKSIWGAYLLNRYGFLLGNRRVEHGIPVADYVATALLDYRSRRGLAGGMELTDEKMRHAYSDMHGLALYYAADNDPSINPTKAKRTNVNHNRYRFALQALWKLPSPERASTKASWSTVANLNILSDKYMLRDYFEDICKVDDKPDNTVRLERRTPRSQTMLFTRFAPNDFYSTDERSEISYYRVRSTLGDTRIAYETRNSAGIMRQNLPSDQRSLYQYQISKLKDPDLQAYYLRLLNTSEFARVNSTHEISTNFHLFQFLNVTPKAGAGFTGYYGVDNVEADNRLLGYVSCDFDIKFSRHFESVHIPSMGIYGLYHVIHPYATISHGTISSSNKLVPQVDTWSSTLGSSTVNPMPLDLMGFTGIDGWGPWTVWRIGARNTFSTIYDDESRTLLDWNVFIDYNVDNPNTESRFSNLYSLVRFAPCRRISLNLETQTPTIKGGDGFNQYNTSITTMITPWLETRIGHRYINSHPVQGDASQLRADVHMRLNEKYTFASRMYWDVEEKRIPIQQYSLFRKFGPWYVGSTLFLRDNGGKKETGFGISFTLGETGTSLPIDFF